MAVSTRLTSGLGLRVLYCTCGEVLVPRPSDWKDPAGLTVTCGNPKCLYYGQRIDPIQRTDTREKYPTVDGLNKQFLDRKVASAEEAKDAARYRWLRLEHKALSPMASVVWKRNSRRDSSDWCNMIDSDDLDRHIDMAMGEK